MPGIDFREVRALVSMADVLELLRFPVLGGLGKQLRGPCPLHDGGNRLGKREDLKMLCSFFNKTRKKIFLFILFFLVIVVIFSFGLQTLLKLSFGNWKDDDLIQKVMSATKTKDVGPENIEDMVGIPATINTMKNNQKVVFLRAHISLDETESSETKDIWNCANVVYWIRPINCENPKIIGICWTFD